ncbi:unnamed protein product [Ixodes persulcatus]
MADQNQRLAQELKAARRAEDQAASQYRSLREQLSLRRSSLDDHVSQLEGLREEVSTSRHVALDLRQVISRRRKSESALDFRGKTSLILGGPPEGRGSPPRIRQTRPGVVRALGVRRRNAPTPCSSSSGRPSLRSAMGNFQDSLQSLLASYPDPRVVRRWSLLAQDLDQCLILVGHLAALDGDRPEPRLVQLRQELAQALQELQRLVSDLRRHRDSAASSDSGVPPSPAEVHPRDVTGHMLSAILADLRLLLQDMLAGSGCQGCQTLAEERAQAEQLRRELCDKSDELRQRSVELSEAQRQLTLHDTELQALHEERDRLRDDVGSSRMAKDEIVKRAWDTRDQAVARKNNTEIELAKTRIELMHINSQLMEAIQQKVELSQQLEQWQVDMQALLDERVKKQLRRQEKEDSRRKAQAAAACANGSQQGAAGRSAGKLFGLWRKSQAPQ